MGTMSETPWETAQRVHEYIWSLPRETSEQREYVRLVKLTTMGIRFGANVKPPEESN